MLKNVKSAYFIKIIFSYLEEKKKLEIVKYNGSLKKSIDISLINYKYFSGKYQIHGNGKVKEYIGYSDKLIYEGGYSNGKRNGKGKEYDYDGILIFEGEYLKGLRNGKGKEYENGKLIFEGEYLNGEKMEKERYMNKIN